jgi:ketosteroid isomerase-like protein
MEKDARVFAAQWKQTCNSHDLGRITALYSDDVVFKSPRVRTVSGEPSGTLRGRDAVRDYWRRILENRPDLSFGIERIFAGVDSVALEYRVGDLRGIEFMTLNSDGLICLAVGNDIV